MAACKLTSTSMLSVVPIREKMLLMATLIIIYFLLYLIVLEDIHTPSSGELPQFFMPFRFAFRSEYEYAYYN